MPPSPITFCFQSTKLPRGEYITKASDSVVTVIIICPGRFVLEDLLRCKCSLLPLLVINTEGQRSDPLLVASNYNGTVMPSFEETMLKTTGLSIIWDAMTLLCHDGNVIIWEKVSYICEIDKVQVHLKCYITAFQRNVFCWLDCYIDRSVPRLLVMGDVYLSALLVV